MFIRKVWCRGRARCHAHAIKRHYVESGHIERLKLWESAGRPDTIDFVVPDGAPPDEHFPKHARLHKGEATPSNTN